MKWLKKTVIIILLAFFVIITLSIYISSPLLGSSSLYMPNEKKAERILTSNYTELLNIAQYISNLDYKYIDWHDVNRNEIYYICTDDNSNEVRIHDKIDFKLSMYLDELQSINIENIEKQNNYICFSIWSSLDSSCGFVYCRDDYPIINDYGETDLKALSIKDWYYYIHISD